MLCRPLPTKPNEVWVGDITYLPLENDKWLYLATWLDLGSHNIVGWHVDDHMEESLITTAFKRAMNKRRPIKGLILHSDGEGQYGTEGTVGWIYQKESLNKV